MPGTTFITASKIQDSTGRLLAAGHVSFFPTDTSGGPVSAIAYGGGMIESVPVVFVVKAGAIAGDLYGNPAQVADSTLTTPANICYRITVTDASGKALQGPGYELVQPSGTSWSLDTYVPPHALLGLSNPNTINGAAGPWTFTGVTQAGSTFAVSGGGGGGGASLSILSEVPGGTIDGTNAVFTLSQAPLLLILTNNGQVLQPGLDYTLSGATITFLAGAVPQPASAGDAADTLYARGLGLSSSGVNPLSETPAGTVDGTNATFTVSHAPLLLILSSNGLLLAPGVDYTLSGSTLTFLSGSIPQAGDVLYAQGIY